MITIKYYIRYIGVLSILILSTTSAFAQNSYDYLATEFQKSTNISLNSGIFSSSIFDDRIQFSKVEISYNNESGDFHRVQTGDKITNLGFSSEGSYIGKRLYMIGKFDFTQNSNKGVRFTSMLDPYRGTPYDLADSTYSNWRSQYYRAGGKIAYELVPNLLSIGVEVMTNVSRGAKQVDPRPKTNNSNIEFSPSISLSKGSHVLSIAGGYRVFKENVDLILYNSSESQKIYEFKGLGQYTYDIFSTTQRERNYNGSGINGLASYKYENGPLTLFLEGKYTNYTEEALDIEESKLKLVGRFYNNESMIKFKTQYQTQHSLNILKLHYANINQSGREIIQVFDPSESVNNWITDSEVPQRWKYSNIDMGAEYSYSLISKSKGYTPLSITALANYKENKESYDVMNTYRNFNSLYMQISPIYNLNWSKKLFSSIKVWYGYNKVSDFDANFTGREIDNQTINEMYFNYDAYIMQQSYSKIGASIEFGYNLKTVGAFVLSASFQHIKGCDNLFRNYLTSSISYNF